MQAEECFFMCENVERELQSDRRRDAVKNPGSSEVEVVNSA